jgi:hypothetical protein
LRRFRNVAVDEAKLVLTSKGVGHVAEPESVVLGSFYDRSCDNTVRVVTEVKIIGAQGVLRIILWYDSIRINVAHGGVGRKGRRNAKRNPCIA